jgi:serine/threonine protein phosphatase PrpC
MAEVFQISSATLTHPGRRRANNEDYIAYFEPGETVDLQASGRLYILADGVGGASKGERASRYAAERVLYEYYHHPEVEPGKRLKEAMRLAGNEIFDYAERSGNYRRMATTMVAAAIRDNLLTVANVGDSRAYLIRNGQVQQLTVDHTTASELMRNGLMSEEEALTSKSKNRLTRSLGGEPDVIVDVFPEIALEPGDRILLCSDGLSRYALPEDIARLSREGPTDEAVEQAIDFANQRGGIDNISVVLVAVGKATEVVDRAPRQPRGHAPTLQDWEVMETRPETGGRKRLAQKKWREIYPPHLQRYALPMTAGLVLFLLVIVVVISLVDGSNAKGAPTQLRIFGPTDTAALKTLLPEPSEGSAVIIEQPPTATGSIGQEPAPTTQIPTASPGDSSPTAASTETVTAPAIIPAESPDDQIPEDQWCVYIVEEGADKPRTIRDIILHFTSEGAPERFSDQVLSTGEAQWKSIWPNGWEEVKLPDKAELALVFIKSKKVCEENDGTPKSKPTLAPNE